MPATGVRPPFLTLVAVRAMAPVAGMPPNSGEAMLATPCATSSMLERCRPPIIPSATTADSSDSIAAEQRDGEGRADQLRDLRQRDDAVVAGVRERRVDRPETAADRLDRQVEQRTTAVVTISATNGPGMRWLTRGQKTMIASASRADATADGLTVDDAGANAPHLARNSAGTAPMRRPRRSLTWLEKMITAMPLVKPVTTG